MSWIPGWDSITAAHWWSNFYFWAGIAALLLLGVFEVVSHRYTERKDELAAQQQSDTQRHHDEEMARLRVDTANADARAAEATARAAEAQLALEKFKASRTLSSEQQTRIAVALKPFAGTPFAFSILPEPEPVTLMNQIASALNLALSRRSARHELRRPHRASRHARPQHHARAAPHQASLHPPLQTDRAPGGRVQAARYRSSTCPVATKSDRNIVKSDQALARFTNANFGLAGWKPTNFPSKTGLRASGPFGTDAGIINSFVGLRIEVPDARFPEWGAATQALVNALNAEPGIEASGVRDNPGTEATTEALAIFIGKKP